jgi:hypothetical protein
MLGVNGEVHPKLSIGQALTQTAEKTQAKNVINEQ